MDKQLALILVLATTAGCVAGKTTIQRYPGISEDLRPEVRNLPIDPHDEALPDRTPSEDWTEGLEAGSCLNAQGVPITDHAGICPSRSGVLISEARAARFYLYRIRYDELRKTYIADRMQWSIQRQLYESFLEHANQDIADLTPGWFARHALELGVVGRFATGAIITVGIAMALDAALAK